MKRFIALYISFILSFMSYAQKVIQMEQDGGTYKIPCIVNGVKMKFIFDTGAASVCISETMTDYLYENEYLVKEDFLGKGSSTIADGSTVEHFNINLRDVEIAGMHLKNVKAVVIQGQKAPLLLGQTAIQELGRITIDGNKLIIHDIENDYSEEDIITLMMKADEYSLNKSFAAAIECYLKVENNWGLSAIGLRKLASCYNSNRQPNDCLKICNRWIKEYESESNDVEKSYIYSFLAYSYYFGLQDHNNAILWFEKVIPLEEKYADWQSIFDKSLLADCYYKLKRYSQAKSLYKNAINEHCTLMDVTISDVQSNKVNDKDLGLYFFGYAFCYYDLNEDENGDELLILAAKCGLGIAI